MLLKMVPNRQACTLVASLHVYSGGTGREYVILKVQVVEVHIEVQVVGLLVNRE